MTSTYIPRGMARAALLRLHDEGAQYNLELAEHLGTLPVCVGSTLEVAVKQGVIGKTYRTRSRARQCLWHITPIGIACVDDIRTSEGAA